MDVHWSTWTEGPPAPLPFMTPEATRLFDVALPLLMRSAPDRRNFWHSRVMSGKCTAPPLSRGGTVGRGARDQPPAPNATTRYSLPYVESDLWAKIADM